MKTQTIYVADKDKLIEPEGSESSADPSGTASQLYARIAEQPFFQGLSAHHLQLLTDSALEMQFEPEQWLFREGDPANRFHLILEGKVMLEADGKDRGLIPIQTVGPGEDLGWSWLFPPYYLHLSARALEPTKTIFFYGTRLREHCEQDQGLGYQLMKRIAEVLIQRLRATQQRLMECADTGKLSTLPAAA
jgi:CRP/FNR family cyclic AMP-dependent transcriptional regulator